MVIGPGGKEGKNTLNKPFFPPTKGERRGIIDGCKEGLKTTLHTRGEKWDEV